MTHEPKAPEESSSDVAAEDESASSDFGATLEAFEKDTGGRATSPAADIQPGTRVKGKVVALGDEYLTIDFGGRSEGVAKTQPFRAEDGSLRVKAGDELDLIVVESGDQIVLAASIEAGPHAATAHLREAKESGAPVRGRVTGVNAGGLEVRLGRARGFCPMSQIESGFCEDPSVHVGKTLEFLVTSVDDGRGGVVLSRKKLLRRLEQREARRLLAKLEPGAEREGTVARLEPFGAFVDLGGVDGMVHVSEIRHERIAHPGDVLKPGEKVQVRVIRIEKDKKGRPRIALSIKACTPDPWVTETERFQPGARVRGTVARLTDFGAFVTLAPGIDGLVHVSQAAEHRIGHVREVLEVGQEIEVHVLKVDPEKKRISLSMRDPGAPSKATLDVPAARAPRGGPRRERSRGRAQERAPEPRPQKDEPQELTTMAIALRKAMEQAKRGK